MEIIVNSGPLTTDLLSDVHSMIPLSPINLLTLKSKVVIPPPGVFTTPVIYCHKHWRRVKHGSNEFWSRWRKKVLATLQCRQKWNSIRRNCKVGDIVLLKEVAAERNSWPMAKRITKMQMKIDFSEVSNSCLINQVQLIWPFDILSDQLIS